MSKGPRKHSTKSWLDDQLKARKFNAFKKMIDLYEELEMATGEDADKRLQLDILKEIWERLYPKIRPVDDNGDAENGTIILNQSNMTPELLLQLVKGARGI